MTTHLPNSHADARRQPPAKAERPAVLELRAMLDMLGSADWCDAMENISLAAIWLDISRAVLALQSTDPRRRDAAADALIDAVMRTVEGTAARLRRCDEFEDSEG